MKTYNLVSQNVSRSVTNAYSTSFTFAIRLLGPDRRQHIYNLYGLVRTADEIVDTYHGADSRQLLDELEAETYAAIGRSYSVNPVVHAFALTANQYAIDKTLIGPFFASMRMDLTARTFTKRDFGKYIYGSAEVVGLMCLKVFCEGDRDMFVRLSPGAQHLGAAFQKVNFLRDIAEDHDILGRVYFPGVTFEDFDDEAKKKIIRSIRQDFGAALPGIRQLPPSVRPAVMTAYKYYDTLLGKIAATPASSLKTGRVRLSNGIKLRILVYTTLSERLKKPS